MERVGDEAAGCRRERGRRLVMFPCPCQGHLAPMLQLATALHSKGFSITVVHSRFNSPDPSHYPDFMFVPISDCALFSSSSLSSSLTPTDDLIYLLKQLNLNCEAPFRDCLARLLSQATTSSEPILCVISDAIMFFTKGVADEFGLPRIALRTSSVTSLLAMIKFLLPTSSNQGRLPLSVVQSDAFRSELQAVRAKDIPDIETGNPDDLYELVYNMISKMSSSSGLIWNTWEELEQESLVKLREAFQVPIFTLGPLHKQSSGSAISLWMQDRSCLSWLHRQAPKSVLYVSFGSLAKIEQEDLVEIAWGLANSKQRFLWVIRPGSVRDSSEVYLPEEFKEETRDRGRIVDWAPQLEVLAHPAVGGFWTHCGWNSFLEGLCEGVPLLCSPSFTDQKVTARYASHLWRVGIQLENGIERSEIEKAVRRLMVEKEGQETKERIESMKKSADLCLREGGSSYEHLKKLVGFILSL